MASETKLSSAVTQFGEDHFTCCICTDRYKNPKILTCLHSFCEHCLKEYYEGRYMNALEFPCPLCQREIELPKEGIKGFKSNFHLSGEVEKFALLENIALSGGRGPSCEICEEKEALSRCFDCARNICKDCLKDHEKYPPLKSHRVATLEDIRQGKVEVKTSQEDDDSKCHKHKGELARFLCEPCFVQICQACTVIDHCPPKHHYIDSGEAVVKYKQSLKDNIADVGKNSEHLQRTLQDVTDAKNEGSSMVHKAKADVQDRADEVVTKVSARVRDEEKRLLDEIDNSWQGYSTSLDERAEAVQSVLQREQHSLQTAEEITNAASDSDFLSLYPIISKDLNNLKKQHPSEIIAKMPTWRLAFDKAAEMPDINLGTLTVGFEKKTKKIWKLHREVSKFGSTELSFARGIAHSSERDEIAVTDCGCKQIAVFSTEGLFKWSNQLHYDPWDVAFIHDQIAIVDGADAINIYKTTPRPGKDASFSTETKHLAPGLRPVRSASLSFTMDGNIVVGDTGRMELRELRPADWAPLRTIPVKTKPLFLAVAGNDRFALSDWESKEVAVVDDNGVTLFKIHPCFNEQRAYCAGVCFGASGLYVAVRGEDEGSGHIHRYHRKDGKFLGCVLRGLYHPQGITITADEQRLIVADVGSVKFFHLEGSFKA